MGNNVMMFRLCLGLGGIYFEVYFYCHGALLVVVVGSVIAGIIGLVGFV